jgi:hypothetical protein
MATETSATARSLSAASSRRSPRASASFVAAFAARFGELRRGAEDQRAVGELGQR